MGKGGRKFTSGSSIVGHLKEQREEHKVGINALLMKTLMRLRITAILSRLLILYIHTFFFNCEKGRMCQSTHLSDIHKICHSPESPNHYLYPCPYIMPLWDKHIFVTGLFTGIHIMNSGLLKRDHL